MNTSSYLAWPVHFRKEFCHPSAHVTLKFFGALPVDPIEVRETMKEEFTRLEMDGVKWTPELFNRAKTPFVMCLYDFDPRLVWAREVLDQEWPEKDLMAEWRPHVTVSGDQWMDFSLRGLQFSDVVESVGPLKLFMTTVVGADL